MSLNSSYHYFANPQGDAHFYYAQYKNNRMKDWRYLRDSGSLEEVLQDVKESKDRANAILASQSDKWSVGHYKTMKWRIIKVDAELIPV